MTAPCCIRPDLTYLNWHSDAERRTRRGERQKKCPKCQRWYWPALQKKGAKR
jgi:hypothetical protein